MRPPIRIGDPPNPQWNMERIHALEAWDLFGGAKANVVAVMDYGIDYTHEDFGSSLSGTQGNLWDRGRVFANYAKRGFDEINYAGSAAKQPDGATRPAPGDFLGNHAAGIIGAVTNNRLGVSGLNWQTQLYSSKIIDGARTPTVGVIRSAIDHIIAMRTSQQSEQLVRSVAFGWSTTTDFGNPLGQFARLVSEGTLTDPTKGILVTVPAGDTGVRTNYPTWYAPLAGTPASVDNILIVGATDENDRPWSGNSNTNRIEIYAPGVNIVSVGAAGSSYSTVTGTRQAAAHVSGAIALIYDAARVNGRTLNWTDVRDAIINGADLVNGIRRLNVMESLRRLNLDTRPPSNGPILTITGGSGAEGNAGVSLATFTVSMDRTYSSPVPFTVKVAGGSAQLTDNDYITPSADGNVTVTIPANQKAASFTVRVAGDLKMETDETIIATLIDTPTDATVAVGSATWTIVNDDAFPVVSIGRGVASQTFSYGFKHVYEAEADRHLISSSGMRKYSEWQSPPITYWGPTSNGVEGQLLYKFDFSSRSQSIRLKASSPTWDFNTEPGGQGRGVSAIEVSGDGLSWVALHDNIAPRNWGVDWSVDGLLPSSVVGTTSLWVRMRFLVENAPNTSYTDAQFGRSTSAAAANIFEVEAQLGGNANSTQVLPEGSSNAVVTQRIPVTLSIPSPLPVTVSYSITPGTAVAGSDYVAPAATATVQFAANQTSQWIPIGIFGDRVVEGDETFTLTLSNPVNATLGAPASTVVTISDDETPLVSVRAMQAAARVGAVSRLVFTVGLSAPAVGPVTVNFAAVDGTAVNGSDYFLPAGVLTFAPGEVSKTIVVTLAARRPGQSYPRVFSLRLSGVSGGKFAGGAAESTAIGTIL